MFQPFLAKRTAHTEAVEAWQHDIEDEHVEVPVARGAEGSFAVRAQLNVVPKPREVVGHIGGEVGLVFNEQ